MTSTRVVYVATGIKYLNLARISIESLRVQEPYVEIYLFTDQKVSWSSLLNVTVIIVDGIEHNWFDKYIGIFQFCDKNVIYLDCDTIIVNKFVENFEKGFQTFQLMGRGSMGFNHPYEFESVPRVLSQINTGVLGIRRDIIENLRKTFDKYRNEIQLKRFESFFTDQSAFRLMVYRENLIFCQLTADYNFQDYDFVTDKIYILHFAANHELMFNKKFISKTLNFATLALPGDMWLRWQPFIGQRVNVHALTDFLLQFHLLKLKMLLYRNIFVKRIWDYLKTLRRL